MLIGQGSNSAGTLSAPRYLRIESASSIVQ
jgi:hypothetical protein